MLLRDLDRRSGQVEDGAGVDDESCHRAIYGYGSRMIVDRAVYRDGRASRSPTTSPSCTPPARTRDAVAWLGLYEPSKEEFAAVAREFGLHELAVEDAVKAHQRPKLERYGDDAVHRPAAGPLRRRDGDGRVRRGGDLRRPAVRDHRAPRRRAGAGAGAAAARGAPGAAAARPAGDHVRDRRPRRRRLPAGRRRPRERHRRDRGRGLRRQPDRLASHLRADARGDRVPARDRPARRDPRAG